MTNLTFEQFLNSKKIISAKEWCEINGAEEDSIAGNQVVDFADGSCYVEIMPEGNYFLVIGNRFWTSHDLPSLAFILYHNWYVYECADFSEEEQEQLKQEANSQKDQYFKGLSKAHVEEFYHYLNS